MEQRKAEQDTPRLPLKALPGRDDPSGGDVGDRPAPAGALGLETVMAAMNRRLLGMTTQAMHSSDLKQAVNALVRMSVGLAGACRGTILLLDETQTELEFSADCAEPGMTVIATGARIGLERWPAVSRALTGGQPTLLDLSSSDLAPAERRLMTTVGAAGLLVIPLVAGESRLGVLLLSSRTAEELTPFDPRNWMQIPEILGSALESVLLRERNRTLTVSRTALFRVSQAAISAFDQSTMLRAIARAAAEAVACEACTIDVWHPDSDELETVAAHVVDERRAEPELFRRMDLRTLPNCRSALRGQTIVQLQPALTGLTLAELEGMQRFRAQCMLVVPMIVRGESLGTLTLAARRPRAFDGDAQVLAQEIAAQTGLALQHARDAERAKRQVEEQAALLRVSRAVISGTSLRDVLDQVTSTAVSLECVDSGRIWLWHKSTQQIELISETVQPDWVSYYQLGERYGTDELPGVACVIESGASRTCLVTEAEMTGREIANHSADGTKSVAMLPILVGDEPLGVLGLYSGHVRRFPQPTIQFGLELAEQAAHAIDRARLYRRLRVRAETDGLTRLLNHRAAFETLDDELNRARTNGTSLGVIVVDLDDFKLFNDTHGHLVGDSVLVEVARKLKATVGESDHVARYGGDEFLVILPGANVLAAASVAERLVERMEDATVEVAGLQLPIRCSVGVATFPRDARTRPELIAYADSSMYAAKELGGGQVGSIQRGTRSLEVSTLGALSGLVRAVDRKDRYTKDHSDLVAEYSVRFGRALQLSPEKIEALELAGQLHDVGKIAVPDSILRKPGHLTPDEEGMIRQHVVFSELMIKGVPHLDDVLAAVAHHHERWDGQGYPNGRSGTQIPLLGRILAFADALAAMTYDRPYRKGRSLQEAVDEIRLGSGTQFDPDLVEPFINAVTSRTGLLSEAARRSSLRFGVQIVSANEPVSSGRSTLTRELIHAGG